MIDDIQQAQANKKENELSLSKDLENIRKLTELNQEKEATDKLNTKGKVVDARYWRNINRDIEIAKEQSDEKSQQSYNQNEESITLNTQQSEETLLNNRDKKENEIRTNALLDMALGKSQSTLDIVANIRKLNESTEFDLNNTIPLQDKQAREKNSLSLKHALENNSLNELQAIKKTNRFYKDALADIDNLKELDKFQQNHFKELMLAVNDANFEYAYNLTAKDEYDNSAVITSSYNIPASLLRGATELVDSSLTLLASVPSIFTKEGFRVNEAHLMKNILNRIGLHTISENDVNSDMDVFDRLSFGLVLDTIATSAPEMFALIASGGTLAAGKAAGKAAILKATKEKTLNKLSRLKDRAVASGRLAEAKSIEQSMKLVDNLGLESFISKKSFNEIAGATAGALKGLPINAFSKASLGTALKSYAKSMSLGTGLYLGDLARRTVDIASGRGDNANITLNDFFGAFVHTAVDWAGAGIIGGIGSKTIFGKELFEGGVNDILTSTSKLGIYKGLGKLLGKSAGIGAVEGIGESIQTYFELQGASNYTLPDLATLLLSDDTQFINEKKAIKEAGVLGALSGIGMAGGVKTVSGIKNLFKKEDETPPPNRGNGGNDSIITGNNSEEFNIDIRTDTFRKMQERINPKDDKNVEAKTVEYQNKIKTLESDIKNKEKEVSETLAKENIDTNLKEDKIYNNNAGKIQQLEYAKSKLPQESEAVKKIDELIENYKKLDNVNNALDNASIMLDIKEGDKERIVNSDKFNKALDKLLDFHNLDTEDSTLSLREIYQEIKDSVNMQRDDVKSLIDLIETKDKASSSSIESPITENEEKLKNSDNLRYDKDDIEPSGKKEDEQQETSDQKTQQDESQEKNAEISAKETTEKIDEETTKDNLANKKENDKNDIKNINQLTSEEIDRMTQDDINRLFDRLSPEATLFVIAKTQETKRRSNPDGKTEANEGFKNLQSRFSLIRIPYSMVEGTREDSAQSPNIEDDKSMFRFMDKEIMLVANNFYDADTNSISSIRKDTEAINPIQRALNAINDINANTYEGLIKDIEDAIANNDSKLAEQKVDELKARFQENVNKVGRHMILINALISSNPSSPLAKQLRLNANIASRTLKSIKAEMIKLSKNLGNKKIEELGDNTISNILDSISENSLAIFNRLKYKIRESRTLDNKDKDYESKKSTLKTFIKRALQAFKLIANKLNELFNDKDFQQTFENTITLLEQGNSALLSNLATQRKIKLSIDGNIQEITLNGVNDLAEVYFYDILYNTFNIKEYGIDSKAILLNKILASVFSKDGKNQDIVDILNYLKEDLQDIRISLPLVIENYENIRLGKEADTKSKTITFSLYDLINADEVLLNELFGDYINSLPSNGETTLSDKIQANKDILQKKLNDLLNQKNNEISKEINNRLSIQIAINDSLSNKLDTLLQIGLLTQAYTAVKSPALDEDKDGIKLTGKYADEYTARNPSSFESTQLAFVRSILGDTKETNSEESLKALLKISVLMANNYMEYKTMKDSNGKESLPLIDATQKHKNKGVFAIHKQLMKKLDLHNKESFDNWLKIMDNQELASNNINTILDEFEKFANRVGIKNSDKKAMMINLQMTGKTLYSKDNEKDRAHTVSIFNKMFKQNITEVYNELSKNLNDPDGHIQSQEYESKKNAFIADLQDKGKANKYKQLFSDIHSGKKDINDKNVQKELKEIPLCYIPIRQKKYNSNGVLIENKTVYVFSPSMSMLNKHFANQVDLSNSSTNALDTLFNIGDNTSLDEVLGTIDGRLQQNGEYAFKLFNAYENVTFKENNPKNFNDKVDYSENTYYLSDLLPNNRVANKIANTEQDNKILRESSSYVLPKTIKVYENGKIVEKPNTDALQWNGKKPNNADEVSPDGKYKEHYYGLLYSLAMTFGVDFDKVKLVPNANKSKEQHQKDFEKAVKELNNLHNLLYKEKDIKKRAEIQNKIIKAYERLNKEFTIDYVYEGQSLSKLLDGLLRDDKKAQDKYKELWSKRILEDINVFSEHPGISIKNGRTFLEAIKSNNFIDNIQTQNLIIYADGKATFSAQNSVRFNSIEEIDALSGISKGNINSNQFSFNTTLPFIKEQAILASIKDKVNQFAANNKDFDNYKAILANKGIDAYTIAIGPTTLTMRGLSNTNTLFTSLFSQELFDRGLIKKPTQAPNYGQEINSILDSYIDAIKIPFNRVLFRLFETNFLDEKLSNGQSVRDTLVELNKTKNHPNKEEYQNEIIAIFKRTLDKRVLDVKTSIDNAIANGNKINDFNRIEYELLKGLQANFSNPLNIKNMLFNDGKTTNIMVDFTQNGKKRINYTNLNNYFFEENNGLLFKDKNIIINYYENFDFVDKQTINRDMLNNANNIVNVINDNANNKAFFKRQNKKWFKGFEKIEDNKGTTISNDYITIKYNQDSSVLSIEFDVKLKEDVNEIQTELGFEISPKDINIIIANTLQFYIFSEGSFLPEHKSLALRANPTLAIVRQNNAYIKEQRKLIENRLIEVFDEATNNILLDAYRKISGKENVTKLADKDIKRLKQAFDSNEEIVIDRKTGKKQLFREYIYNKKDKVLNQFIKNVYGDFWAKDNKNLYVQIFKKHPSLDEKTRFAKLIDTSNDELDNRLQSLLMNKLSLGGSNTYSSLSTTRTIMSDVIGQFNHPFEALLITAMNNPTTQIFDAYIGNANNIVRFMDTWNKSLASLSGANVDSAVILNNFYKSLQNSMDKALSNNGINKLDNQNVKIEKMIKNNNAEGIVDLVRFNLNLLRHTLQLSSTDRALANNAVGLHTINNSEFESLSQNNSQIYNLQKETFNTINSILKQLKNNGTEESANILNKLQNNIDYNIFGEEDINLNDNNFLSNESDKKIVDNLYYKYKDKITEQTRKLLNTTFKTKLPENNKPNPNIIRIVFKNMVNGQVFSKQHNILNINKKTSSLDISYNIFNNKVLNIGSINEVLQEINLIGIKIPEETINQVIFKLKKTNKQVSITDIAEAILTIQILDRVKPKLSDSNSNQEINEILNRINYNNLVIEANSINANGKVSIDENIQIDINDIVAQEKQLLISLFGTKAFKNALSNDIKNVKQTIENNSKIGKATIVINRKSYNSAINGIRRLTDATASATELKIENGVKSDTIFFNKNTSDEYYNMFFDDKEKKTINDNINNFKDTNPNNNIDTNNDNIVYDTDITSNETNPTESQTESQTNKQQTKTDEQQTNVLKDSDEILGDDYSPNVTSTNEQLVEQSFQQYQKDMNSDLQAMKKDKNNAKIVDEITMIESLVNGLVANLKKGIRFFKSNKITSTRGAFDPSENQIIIYNGANRGTRTHEFLHASLNFAFNNMSNETKYYISQISNLHREVKAYFESLDETEREKQKRKVFSDYGNVDKRYNYIFGQSNDTNLQEFCSVALTSPRIIEFLSSKEFTQWLNRTPSFKIEANSKIGKLIKAIPTLIGYIYKLIKNRLSQEPRNGFKILTTSISKLSNYNTEEGQLAEQAKYQSGKIYRANTAIRKAGLVITKNVEHYITKMKQKYPDYNADKEVEEIKNDLSKKINEISKSVKALRELDNELQLGRINRIQRTIKTGIWLLQSIYYNNLGLKNLMSSPIKHQLVSNAMQELRQAAIENTIFDARIILDIGITSTKFLKKFVNSVNRALSFRTELDANKEVASSNIAKQVSLILARPSGLADRFANDKNFKKAYSEGASKLIIHQNLGDYFFGDENVNRKDLNVLVDFVLNDNEDTNTKIKEVKKAKIESAMRALGIEIDSDIHKSIAKIVDSMGITRITDKKNSLGTQNIEQMLKELDIDFENNNNGNEALKQLHQAITLAAILAPRTNGRDIFKYVNSKTEVFRKTYMNSNKKTKDEIRESIKDLIVLHKDKLDKLYTQKVLNFNSKEVQENLKNTKLEQMYYMSNDDNYINTTAFEYKKSTAYYSDSYKPSEYNQTVTLVTLDTTKDTFKKEKEALLKKGFKLELVSSTSSTETFKYDGLIDYNSGKDRRGFMYRAMTHKGQVIQFLEQDEVERLKPIINEDYKKMRKQELLNYGKDYKDDYVFDNAEFNDLTRNNKSFAGSETMIRDNISIQQLEEWTELDTSLESAFRSMERTIQDNVVRDLNNNLIFQQVLLSNKEINDRDVKHHTEVLFRIGLDRNGNARVTFNNALTDKYGFELTDKDVSDFTKLYKAMNDGKLPNKAEIKIDTRMIGMLFGFDVPTFSSIVEGNPIKFKIFKALETLLRFLVKETRNNTIIRNPNLVWENFKGNVIGLVGEGVTLEDILKTIPYYIEELNKYQRDMKEKVRISNEIVMKEKKEYRDKRGISAEAQANEVKALKKQLALINDNMKTNAVAPLMGQGLYTNIVEDAETSGFKWDKALIDFVSDKQKLTKGQTTFLNELFMTEQSDIYQTMAYLTRLGDFIPRVILYYHIMGKGRQTINGVKETNSQLNRRALDEARDRFINYNTPMWSPTLRLLDRFGFTNYAKYAFNVEKQILTAFTKAPIQAISIMGLQLGLDAMGVNKILIPSSYLTEAFIVDGKLPSGFLNPTTPLSTFIDNLNRWNYVMP